MQRIYLPDIPLTQELIVSQKDLYHQITRVMRARVGQKYVFFDGVQLRDEIYEIESIDKRQVIFTRIETLEKNTETQKALHLYQALPHKLEKLEYIIAKGVEVGYRSFTFFPSERSQKLVLSTSKIERLKKIMRESLEQCGGNILPELYIIEDNVALHGDTNSLQAGNISGDIKNIFCHTDSQDISMLGEISVKGNESIGIYIGPEGGFTTQEAQSMQARGYIGVNFGPRILRCETVSSVLGFFILQSVHK